MKPTISLSLCFVIFFLYVCPTSKGLQCYSCVYDSFFDKEETCKEGMIPDKKYLTQCNETDTVCSTGVATAKGLKYVIRECNTLLSNETGVDNCHETEELDVGVKAAFRICFCNTDKCNSGALLMTQHFSWIFFVSASFFGSKVLT